MTVAILCGGRGTRMRDVGETLPKPLVEVGGMPVLWHVMSLYASQGLRRFLLLTGNGGRRIEEFAAGMPGEWEVECLDTGIDTPTGGRVARAGEALGDEAFCLTYADGVADIDLRALIDFHGSHGGAATMTVVRPSSPWGEARLEDDGRVSAFVEKPRLASWINGGFFVMEPRVLQAIDPSDALEGAPLESLAATGELFAFRHDGFWACMDTYKDTVLLNELWARGEAPWHARVGV